MALTEKQMIFVDTYCDAIEAGVRPNAARTAAKREAGYSENTTYRDIITDDMVTEIRNYATRKLALGIPTAIAKLESVLEDPNQPGAKVSLDALGQLLDRAAVSKKESKEVTITDASAVVVLPAKALLDEESK